MLQNETKIEIVLVAPQEFQPAPQTVFGRFSDHLNLNNLTLLVRPTPFPSQTSPLARLWFEQVTFPNSCKDLDLDVIHIPYYGAPLRSVKPLVITAHDLIPLILPEYQTDTLLSLYGRLIAATLPKGNLLLTPSQASKNDIIKHLDIQPTRIQVTHEAPAPYFQRCLTGDEKKQLKHALPPRFILYIGGYEKRKNINTLIHAFHLARRQLPPDTALVLAGKLPQKNTSILSDPRPIIQRLNLQNDVHLPGWIPEAGLPCLYQSADLFVYPSYYEGFGLPVLEAMACGTAVLTTTAASLPEIAGSAAAFVAPNDVRGMAQKMAALYTDKSANQSLVQSGFDHVKQFSWHKTATQTIQSYQAIL